MVDSQNPPVIGAKQDPQYKQQRSTASDGRVYFSYADIHKCITSLTPQIKEFRPDVIIAIGGGGFIPARMLRTSVKVPILAISLELYDDDTKTAKPYVVRKQWFDTSTELGAKVPGGRVLIVDEVDDSRKTLQYAVEEIKKHKPAALAVAVVHNKLKEKKGVLSQDVLYLAGDHVAGESWNCYPWDSEAYDRNIDQHEKLARICCGGLHDDGNNFLRGCFFGMAVAGFVGICWQRFR